MQLSKSPISFGSMKIGQFKDTTLKITNLGINTLKINNITSSHSTFNAKPIVLNIAPGQSFVDTPCFAPLSVGADSALLVIQSNSGSSPDTVKVSGFGDPPTSVNGLVKIPTSYTLSPNYTNPFNPAANISFTIPRKSFVSLKIFDLLERSKS